MKQKADMIDILLWILVAVMFFCAFTFGIYRMFVEEENEYIFDEYLQNEVKR